MEFRILGPLEVVDGNRVLRLGGPKRRAVLALLLLDANRTVSVESLVDGVWGDKPPKLAIGSLHNQVLALRRELGPRVRTCRRGYLLEVEPDELDSVRFGRLVEEARHLAAAGALPKLREALALWRGRALADLAGEPVAASAAFLDEQHLAALEDRLEVELALGRHAEVIPELEVLVLRHPYRERLWRQLMLALYRGGRQVDALQTYADARRILVKAVGVEPGRELQELQRQVLRHDPSLDRKTAWTGDAPGEDDERLRLGQVLYDCGERSRGRRHLRRLEEDAAARGDGLLCMRSKLLRYHLELFGDRQEDPERVWLDGLAAIPLLAENGDEATLARVYLLLWNAADRMLLMPPGGMPEGGLGSLAEKSLVHARRAGSHELQAAAIGLLSLGFRRGATPVPTALRRADELLRDPPNEFARAAVLGGLAVAQAMTGDFDRARATDAVASAILDELGLRRLAAAHDITSADIELIADDFAAAERLLRACHQATAAFGDIHSHANAAWRLALARARLGAIDEAERLVAEAEEMRPHGIWVVLWMQVIHSQIAARRGQPETARSRLIEAENLAQRLPRSGMQADLLLEAAAAAQLCGWPERRQALLQSALSCARGLGYSVAEARVSTALASGVTAS